jgi:hypothetical protein
VIHSTATAEPPLLDSLDNALAIHCLTFKKPKERRLHPPLSGRARERFQNALRLGGFKDLDVGIANRDYAVLVNRDDLARMLLNHLVQMLGNPGIVGIELGGID